MGAGQATSDAPGGAVAAGAAQRHQATGEAAGGVLAEVSRVAASAREVFSSFLELVTLEAQRAGAALVWMIAGAVAAALLCVTGWLALVAAFALWVVSLGFPPAATALVIALVSLAAAGGLVYVCIAMTRALLFPATQRQLAGKPPGTVV